MWAALTEPFHVIILLALYWWWNHHCVKKPIACGIILAVAVKTDLTGENCEEQNCQRTKSAKRIIWKSNQPKQMVPVSIWQQHWGRWAELCVPNKDSWTTTSSLKWITWDTPTRLAQPAQWGAITWDTPTRLAQNNMRARRVAMPDMKITGIYRSALPIQEMRHGLDEYLNHVCFSMNWSYCNYI